MLPQHKGLLHSPKTHRHRQSRVCSAQRKKLLWLLALTLCVSLVFYTSTPHHQPPQSQYNRQQGWAGQAASSSSSPYAKVALMFLTRGAMPLEAVWREFLGSAALLQPVPDYPFPAGGWKHTTGTPSGSAQAAARKVRQRRLAGGGSGSSSAPAQRLRDGCTGKDVVAAQNLFSIVVHPAPGYSFAPANLFCGYAIEERVDVKWGQFSVVEAEKNLLTAALWQPANQRFVLLSESCLPIYPPQIIYTQVMSESRSRINACKTRSDGERRGIKRWNRAMRTSRLNISHWRKSSQWVSLTRRHAEVVAADTHAAAVFRRQCFTFLPWKIPAPNYVILEMNGSEVAKRQCVSDEHYVPTLLAMHGLDGETDCQGQVTHADWWPPGWSPKTYSFNDTTPELVTRLRTQWFTGGRVCAGVEALATSNKLFRRRAGGWAASSRALLGSTGWAARSRALLGLGLTLQAATGSGQGTAQDAMGSKGNVSQQQGGAGGVGEPRALEEAGGVGGAGGMAARLQALQRRRERQEAAVGGGINFEGVQHTIASADLSEVGEGGATAADALRERLAQLEEARIEADGELGSDAAHKQAHRIDPEVDRSLYHQLHPACSLFARKFGSATLDAVLVLGADCGRGFAWAAKCVKQQIRGA